MSVRRAAKIDNNQNAIVNKLRKMSRISVAVGHDDIIVGYNLMSFWFEIKTPDQVSKRTGQIKDSALKPSQKQLRRDFKGHYSIVWSIEQILDEIGYRGKR